MKIENKIPEISKYTVKGAIEDIDTAISYIDGSYAKETGYTDCNPYYEAWICLVFSTRLGNVVKNNYCYKDWNHFRDVVVRKCILQDDYLIIWLTDIKRQFIDSAKRENLQ